MEKRRQTVRGKTGPARSGVRERSCTQQCGERGRVRRNILGSLRPEALEGPEEGPRHWVSTELERPNLYTNPQTDLFNLTVHK